MKAFIWMLLLPAFAQATSNQDLLQSLVRNESHGRVIQVFQDPAHVTNFSAEYSFNEIQLSPQDVVYFHVPQRFAALPLSQLGFSHRQTGYNPGLRDPRPGLTSAQVYTTDMPGDEWRHWGGPASGRLGAKFAEYRSSPEMDTLYEWPRIGHRGLNSGKKHDLIKANVVRLQNVGSDNVLLSKLYLEVVPPVASEKIELIFTPNSHFGDSQTIHGRWYGGGQVTRGTFPNSLRLSREGHRNYPSLPSNFTVQNNRLIIKLAKGKRLQFVDIMCGDTHPDGARNKDGGWGSLGNARLSVYVENTVSGLKRQLMTDKNVGPQGVISAFDLSAHQAFGEDDKLIIENHQRSSTAYIMGLRIGLNE